MRKFEIKDKEHSKVLAKVKYYLLEVLTTLAIDAETPCVNCRFEDVVEHTYKNLLHMYKEIKNFDSFNDGAILEYIGTALKNVTLDPDADIVIFKRAHGRDEMNKIVEALYETLEHIDSEYFYSVY